MGLLSEAFKKSRCKTNKRGQLQIQETILVVFIFIVLIMFGLVFFYRVQSASIIDAFNEFQMEKLSIDFITMGDLPEFSCSKAGVLESCVDTVKLAAFMGLSGGPYKDYYRDRLGYKNITIRQIYPRCGAGTGRDCASWTVYVYKPNNVESKIVRDTPVSLYFPCTANGCSDEEYRIGLMVVEAYNV